MYYPVELVVKNYKPLLLENGMLFITRHKVGTENEYAEIWELKAVPMNKEEFINEHGYPIELALIDEDGKLIASHEEIGWWDESIDELRCISLKDINRILVEYDGILEVDIDEFYYSMGVISSKIFDGRVIMRILQEEYEEEI